MFKYLSLGDSIAYGMSSDDKKGFADLYSSYLEKQYGLNYCFSKNAFPGWQTSDLLKSINSKQSCKNGLLDGVSHSTLSIGSNNLLGPIFNAIPNEKNIKRCNSGWKNELLEQFLNANFTKVILNKMLEVGLKEFIDDFPVIISSIRNKSPQSEIFVLTLYRALKRTDPYFEVFDPYIIFINDFICKNSQLLNYKVIDVCEIFEKSKIIPMGFNLEANELDPHPNNFGHRLIYEHISSIA